MKRISTIAVLGALLVSTPAIAQEPQSGLIPPAAAGWVEVAVDAKSRPFGAKAAARSARRALRRRGFEQVTATCTRSARRAATCTVSGFGGIAWTGTADVTRAKRVDHVHYDVVGS